MRLQNGYSYQISLDSLRRRCYYGYNERRSEPAAEKLAVCQKLAVRTLKIEYWKILFFTVNGKGEAQMLYDTIIPAFGFLIVCLLIYREVQKW